MFSFPSRIILRRSLSLTLMESPFGMFSTSAKKQSEVQMKQQRDPKKISNVRGCVPMDQQQANKELIESYAKSCQAMGQKLADGEKCGLNLI